MYFQTFYRYCGAVNHLNYNLTFTIWRSGLLGVPTERSGVRMPVGSKDLSLLQNVQTGSGIHRASYSKGVEIFSGG